MPKDQSGSDKGAQASETFRILVDGDAAGFACRADQNVLQAMRAAGRSVLAVGCRGGGCGVCRVVIAEGQYEAKHMSAAWVTAEQAEVGMGLACRIYPRSDLRIEQAPRRCRARRTDAGKAVAA
ncbi:2Fe-2S iron-sulfur cluster-binding protein [Novosphingobium mangrovi (ex Huang et al. 2023)]|uniref:2Fe-2S iron-sulfur cluster-binding protein n=1 Tax=Novosphingobium mangrovi (ex Huang et al. 2023) TaxID=2976432 RepID=A0ABT2I9B3_9SPHN|nr:2Fe-2S iron-sulfur cluster-binding protein [Novosphingobium mangrovi (ex Huang et al. 2023)]MCT2401403.1 2Fe-2S iron-sulfur cluster-binding protein [Novosphingobium mangrovi (ex Huang et al. 2023)]